jgi:hypothetical protein
MIDVYIKRQLIMVGKRHAHPYLMRVMSGENRSSCTMSGADLALMPHTQMAYFSTEKSSIYWYICVEIICFHIFEWNLFLGILYVKILDPPLHHVAEPK